MKALIIIFAFMSTSIFYMSYETNINKPIDVNVKKNKPAKEKIRTKHDPINDLIVAIIYVESRGDSLAVNTSSNAVGCMQIRPVMVRDVNRILSKSDSETTYSLNDRYSKVKSIEMFKTWLKYYHSD